MKEPVVDKPKETVPSIKPSLSCLNSVEKFVLLPTAVVKFVCGDVSGTCRILLDSCSQPNLISDTFVRKFKLPIGSVNYSNSIKGVLSTPIQVSSSVSLKLVSNIRLYQIDVVADIVPASSMSYSAYFNSSSFIVERLRKFRLADPAFLKKNIAICNIDLIIGAEHFEKIICNKLYLIEKRLFVCLSQFG